MPELYFTDLAQISSGWLPLALIQESEKTGKVWRIKVIDSGWSQNGFYYSPKILKEAIPLFEGAKICAYEFDNRFFNHLPGFVANLVKQGFAKNVTGWIDNVRYEKTDGKDGLTADYHITDSKMRETYKNAWEDGKKRDLLGFSIDAQAKVSTGIAEGRKGNIVEKIHEVTTVDQVTLPAAGGKFLRMVASMGGKKMDKLIKWVRENPEILGLKEGENIEDKSDEEVLNMFVKTLEAKKKKKPEEEKETEEAKKKKKEEEEEKKKKMKESQEQIKEMIENLTETEKDLFELLSDTELEESTKSDLQKVIGLLKDKKIEEATNMLKEILAADMKFKDEKYKKYKEKYGKMGESEKEKKEETEEMDELGKKMKTVDEALEKLNVRESNLKLKEILSEEKILPDLLKEKIRKQYEDQVFDEEKLQESIKEEKEILAKLSESGEVKGMGSEHVTTGLDEKQRKQIAMYKMFDIEPEEDEKEDWAKVPAFRGIKESYIKYTGDIDVSPDGRGRITEALSTDYPNALGDALHRKLLKIYSMVPVNEVWRKFVTIDKPSDYKDQYFIRVGGLTDLPTVLENGEYTEYVSPSEEQASYKVTKRGKILRVTREMIKNDDLRIIQQLVKKMGQAAARTLAKFVFDLILNYTTASGAINGGTIYDSIALYHANHNNVTYDTLDFNSVDTAITAMGNFTEADSDEPIDIKAKWLLVPYELRSRSKVIIDSEKRPVVATSGAQGTVESTNPVYQALDVLPVPKGYLRSDQNNWYVLADKALLDYLIIGFLDGKETPEMFLQDQPGVDQVFTNDAVRYKIRHEYSGVVTDYRGFYGGLQAGIS